jgi:UDP-N-acetylglucosamine diphosphorylase/glucosamine-1-phosphate N-acetyltransferase
MQKTNVVIIMAGGLGKRMNSDLPKVLHKIGDKPMLVHVILQAQQINPSKIICIVGKYKDIIINTVKEYIPYDNDNIVFVNQPEPLGTGHAIQCCINELTKYDHANVIILSGDVPLLKNSTISDFLQNVGIAKLMTTEFDNPTGYGRIIEENGIFQKIVEDKDCLPDQRLTKKVNCGIYAFNSNILVKYLPYLTNNNSQKEYYLTDIVEIIKQNEHVKIDTMNIPKERQYEIMGVNTVDQLRELECLMI